MDELTARAQALDSYLTGIRRRIHMHPELGEQEYETQKLIMGELDALGIEHSEYPGYTAVVGLIRGAKPGRTVGLRADMDALPLTEAPGREYGSQVPGRMHACGHDAHVTILLGAARLLSAMKDELRGNVKLLFQPAEETVGGAEPMIRLGCMENPHVDYVLGLHVMPYMPVGDIETRYGALNGSSDDIDITVRGKKAHGASPQLGVDAIAIAAQIISALQQQVSRRVSPLDSAVVSIGCISGGSAPNIICDEVRLQGTLRTLSPETRERMKAEIGALVTGIAAAMGGSAELRTHSGYCALINDREALDRTLRVLRGRLGEEHVHMKEAPSLGVEDFAYFCNAAPGAFYHLGVAQDETTAAHCAPLHSSEMDIDERALALGAELQTRLVLDYLNG